MACLSNPRKTWRGTAKALRGKKKRPRIVGLYGGRELYMPALTDAEARAEALRYKAFAKRDARMKKAERKVASWGEKLSGELFGEKNPAVAHAGPSAIPTKWTPASITRKGRQIQIRIGGRR